MSISDQIRRLQNAKAAIKQAITNKGVTVSDEAKIDEYPALIDSIEAGGDTYYEDLFNIRTNNGFSYIYLFSDCAADELDLSRLDTSGVYTMNHMFYSCKYLTSLDLSSFDTSKVIHMSSMFSDCISLQSLDLSSFDTSNVSNISYMFQNCTALQSLNLSSFDTSNVSNIQYMFKGCANLESVDLSNFDTSDVRDMRYMFSGCTTLQSLDLSSFDTSNVEYMSYMFQNCTALQSLDLSGWDTSKVTQCTSMFDGCVNLQSLDLSSFDVEHIKSNTYLKTIINNCTALVDFQAPKNINGNLDVSTCTALSHDSLMSVINNLVTTTSTKTLTLGSTNLAKITDEEKAIATSKGWTVK